MNLHLVPDNVFINKFYDNLQESGTLQNNRVIVRTNHNALRYIKRKLPFGKLYSSHLDNLIGDTRSYEKVYIHLFTPLLYRWVAAHHFNELNWMVWGADLYNLPSVKAPLYEPMTLQQYVSIHVSLNNFLYRAKVTVLHERFRHRAYSKINNVLTWMPGEYEFALRNLPSLKSTHLFFFYENDLPYEALDKVMTLSNEKPTRERPLYILGNSSTPELNHLDAIALMETGKINADLLVPLSYGDMKYSRFLKKKLSYNGGSLRFVDHYMNFEEYLHFLNQSDGLIMNNLRPQGYGNIFMMMYLGKKIFLNPRNLSIPELNAAQLFWRPISEIRDAESVNWKNNTLAVSRLLSHSTLLHEYKKLFS